MADLVLPTVKTLAKPGATQLVASRFLVQRNPKVAAAFLENRDKGAAAIAAALTPILQENLEGSPLEVSEVAQYLADEYVQIGDAVLVIDRKTGRAVAKITDEDMWQPPDVSREGGSMATPSKRLRPEIEGYLVKWHFDQEREAQLSFEIRELLAQTDADREEGDRRLLAITHAGRSQLAGVIDESLRGLIPEGVGGSLRKFLNLFSLTLPYVTKNLYMRQQGKAFARIKFSMADHKARNLNFDIPVAHRASIGVQWSREIALSAAQLVYDAYPEPITYSVSGYLPPGLYLLPPDEAVAVQRAAHPMVEVVPIENVLPVRFLGPPVGHLVVDRTELSTREIHDRWEVGACLEYDMYFSFPSTAESIALADLPIPEVRGQVVR